MGKTRKVEVTEVVERSEDRPRESVLKKKSALEKLDNVGGLCSRIQFYVLNWEIFLPRVLQYFILQFFVIVLAGMGGIIFYNIEYDKEQEFLDLKAAKREELISNYSPEDLALIDEWAEVASSFSDANMWEYRYAGFFSATLFTTIGYGFQVPKTNLGRLFAFLYGLPSIFAYGYIAKNIGVLTLSLFSTLIKYLPVSQNFYKNHRKKIIASTTLALCMFLAHFLTITATDEGFGHGIYKYGDSIYFLLQSIFTIGYGDVMMSGTNVPMMLITGIWFATILGIFITIITEAQSFATKKTLNLKRKSIAAAKASILIGKTSLLIQDKYNASVSDESNNDDDDDDDDDGNVINDDDDEINNKNNNNNNNNNINNDNNNNNNNGISVCNNK